MTVNVSKPSVNVREKLAELDKPTGIAGEAMLRAETPQEQFNLIGAGRRNILINGDFQVSQRGDYSTSSVAVSNGGYYLDRWKVYENTVAAKIQQTDVTVNGLSKNAAKVFSTTSGTGYIGIYQKIELQNIPVGATVTASAWVRSTNPDTRFYQEHFGGVSSSYSDAFQNTGEWEYVTWTFETSGTTSTPLIGILTWDGSTVPVSSTDYVEVTMFQLELGKVATPFEHRSYGEELALCQRYYWKEKATTAYASFGIATVRSSTSSELYFAKHHVVPMRATPSVSINALRATDQHTNADAITGATLVHSSSLTSTILINTSANMTWAGANQCVQIGANNSTGAYIDFDAEL